MSLQDFEKRMERDFADEIDSLTALSKFVVLQPTMTRNPVADALFRAIVAHLKGALPGELKERLFSKMLYETGSYRALFFPSYTPDPYESILYNGPYDHLEQAQWSDFAVALLCQDIYKISASIKKEMRKEAIDRQIQNANSLINNRLWIWYAQVFMHEMPEYASLVTELGGPEQALLKYEGMLQSSQWLEMVTQMLISGNFPDPEWFFYHTWIKLVCLGVRDLDNLIDEIVRGTNGTLPSSVRKEAWRSYQTWMPARSISYEQFKEADSRIVKYAYLESGDVYVKVPEFYAQSFFDDPGNIYKNEPSSCFAAGSMVRMADRTLRAIEHIQAGDQVLTPNGPRSVMLLVNEDLAGRYLYSLNDCTAKFTALHPFVRAGEEHEPQLAAIEPRHLGFNMPTMSALGIMPLNEDTVLHAYQTTEYKAEPTKSTIRQVLEHEPQANVNGEQLVYDLILEPNELGTSEYYIGDDSIQFLAMSEFPAFMHAPLLTATMLMMLHTMYENIGDTGINVESINSFVAQHLLSQCINDSIVQALAVIQDVHVAVNTREIISLFQSHPLPELMANHLSYYRGAHPEDAHYHRSNGRWATLLLSKHAEQLQGAVSMGWRRFSIGATGSEYVADAEVGERTGKPGSSRSLHFLPTNRILALSVHSLCLDAEEAMIHRNLTFEITAAVQVNKHLYSTVSWTKERDAAVQDKPSLFCRTFYDELYFAEFPIETEQMQMQVQFTIVDADTKQMIFSACNLIEWPLSNDYAHRNALLLNVNGVDCGFLYFDLRLITPEDVRLQTVAKQTWSKEREAQFAFQFGAQMGSVLSQTLPKLLSELDEGNVK
ncbi:hypothetical protein BBG47_11200 [Paenibacillus sp. KS1]|uniref:hypothetical protein n=1 Tax=Paenibacillus sp. KS1 TaxID=1849249 RepID=UPI0008066265|nr:hypothetical protein [Paenibacillus sp. KS1]OBY79437.1 hypothetical protein BBG47_11200 [Paenibacillus sp. KS1]